MEIGCCAPIEKYQAVSDAGFDFAELLGYLLSDYDFTLFKRFVQITNMVCLPVIRISSYCSGQPKIVGDGFDPKAIRTYARGMAIKAEMLGVEYLGIGSPKARILPEGYDASLADEQCLEFLDITCAEARECGVGVLLEAVHPGYCNYLNDTAKAVELIERAGKDNLHLVLDLYNMKRNGESWDDIKKYVPYIRHMHISTDLGGTSRGVYLPADEAELRETVRAIKASGYKGTVSMEPEPSRTDPEELRGALKMMRRICAEENI